MTIRKAALPVVLPYRDNGQIEQTFIRSPCNLGRARQGCGTCNETLGKLDVLAGMPNMKMNAPALSASSGHANSKRLARRKRLQNTTPPNKRSAIALKS
jgi:hypothetical protein